MKKPSAILTTVVIVAGACVEQYDFTNYTGHKIMVVEGYIADEPGESFISLGFTSNINDFHDSSITGAIVTVVEDGNKSIVFNEVKTGLYKPNDNITGKTGAYYQLNIQIGNEFYQSDEVLMEPALPVDTITIKSQPVYLAPNVYEEPLPINYYVSSKSDEQAGKYYTFDIEETYLAKSIHSINQIYVLEPVVVDTITMKLLYLLYIAAPYGPGSETYLEKTVVAPPEFVHKEYPPKRRPFMDDVVQIRQQEIFEAQVLVKDYYCSDTLEPKVYRECWNSRRNRGFELAQTEELRENMLIDAPAYSMHLGVEYIYENSVLVKERTLNSDAFKFLETVRGFRANGFELTRVQPGFVGGNIIDVNNAENKVFGCFYASSYNTKRFFIKRYLLDEVAKDFLNKINFDCDKEIVSYYQFDTTWQASIMLKQTDTLEYTYQYHKNLYTKTQKLEKLKKRTETGSWVLYDIFKGIDDQYDYGEWIFNFRIMTKNCYDCRNFGTPVKPDFWHE